MGIKPDKTLNNNLTDRDVKCQGININRNSKNIEDVALTSTYINDIKNNIHVMTPE